MKRLNLTQGSKEWHAHRATARNASEVSAVLGCSPYMTRSELLQTRHTGIRPEASAEQQRRYDDGHAIEASQRPGAALVIGEELYPVVGSEVVEGIELSASFDGLTMAEDIGYECKTLNDELRAALAAGDDIEANDRRALPKHYRAQMEQQLMVCGGERILFTAADRRGDDVRRCWYYPDPDLRAEILAGWRQFDADLAAYTPAAPAAVEKVVAEPVEALPAVSVMVEGTIVIRENFDAFEAAARHFLDTRLIREPKTDQDFADLDVQIKAMKGAEAALEAAEAGWIAQIAPVSAAKRRKDMLHKLVRENRLMAERLLKDEKERRRGEIVAGGVAALQQHVAVLNKRLGKPYMPTIRADFAGAIRGMRSLASMEDAVSTELARAKIEANEIASTVQTNLTTLRELAADHSFLFADTAQLVLKSPEDCQAQITSRIAAHKAEEERRAAELAERERARIRAEEEARARAQQERCAKVQQRIDAIVTAGAGVTEAALIASAIRTLQSCQITEDLLDDRVAEAAQARVTRLQELEIAHAAAVEREQAAAALQQRANAAPTPNVRPMPTRAPAAAPAPRTLTLTAIGQRLGFSLPAAFVQDKLGVEGEKDRSAVKFSEHEFDQICIALADHVEAVRVQHLQKAA